MKTHGGALEIAADVRVPKAGYARSAVRASGPGGQNVNKVSSKIELRVDLAAIEGLDVASRQRLAASVAGRLDAAGWLVLTSAKERDQHRNFEDAVGKLAALVRRAQIPPKKRKKTRPTLGAKERRLTEKKRHGERKSLRRSTDDR